jgi:voltage-gated potassium channel
MEQRPAWKKRLYEIIFESDTRLGKAFDVFLLIIIVFSTVVVMLESVPDKSEGQVQLFQLLEWVFTILFTIEYLLRLLAVERKTKYMLSFYGVVDLLSILPSYLALVFSG